MVTKRSTQNTTRTNVHCQPPSILATFYADMVEHTNRIEEQGRLTPEEAQEFRDRYRGKLGCYEQENDRSEAPRKEGGRI